MGLPRAAVGLLSDVFSRLGLSGRIATLGRQHVYVSPAEAIAFAAEHSFPVTDINPTLHREPSLRSRGYISDDSLFQLLGFSECVRIDNSDYEGADKILDLNVKETPNDLIDSFDVVLDCGTVEHVFDVNASLSHCLRMTRPGGCIIHLSPSSNAVNHGFYSISPTLYQDFYSASGCEVEMICLCRMGKNFLRGKWEVYDCSPTDRDWLPLGRLGDGIWCTFAVLKKLEGAEPKVPQQGFYSSTWKTAQVSTGDEEPPDSKAGRLLHSTKRWPVLNSGAQWLISTWRNFLNWYDERKRGRVPYPKLGDY